MKKSILAIDKTYTKAITSFSIFCNVRQLFQFLEKDFIEIYT